MPRSLSTSVAVFALFLATACGEDTTPEAGTSSTTVPVCGEGGVGFMRWSAGGGQPPWSSLEVGHYYFAVAPDCRFVLYEPITGSLGMAVEGTLDQDQARELSQLLALEQWEDLGPSHRLGQCAPDSGGTTYWWGARSLNVALCIDAPMLPPNILEIHAALYDAIEELQSLGDPVSGSVRYALAPVGDGVGNPVEFNGAPAWPLDIAPEVLSQPLEPDRNNDVFLQPTQRRIWVAEEEDAAQLRSLRTSFLNREFGTTSSSTIAILQPDGSKYRLAFRDVVTGFEEDGRPIVPWLTEGHIRVTAVISTEVSRVDFAIYCADAPNPIATGTLENTYGGDQTTYWNGGANDLPAGPCRVELDAFWEQAPVDCVEYAEIEGTASVTVRPGWTESAIFRCGGSG